MTVELDNPQARVGARVLILSQPATVRYVGPVAGQQGVWVGVEYDDPERGKHDGVTGGQRYFTTQGGATSGSFVRIEKVTFGVSVLDALRARYTNQKGELGDVKDDQLYVRTASKRRVQIQVVGTEQIQALQSETHRLVSARLVGAAVSYVGESAELSVAGASLTELDLTNNLISTWSGFVPELMTALPALQVLNLSENRLMWPGPCDTLTHITQLRALVLNDCQVTWTQVSSLQRALPNLEELHLSGNHITSLAPPPPHDTTTDTTQGQQGTAEAHTTSPLQVLSLDDNKLTDWCEITRVLGPLPSLRVLNLSHNPLTHLSHIPPGAFPALKALYLASCDLCGWGDVDCLNELPALTDVRLSGNPVLNNARGGGRYEVIGRIGRITLLNGAAVSVRERTDSEVRYLQAIQARSGSHTPETLPTVHPRYTELLAKHGQVTRTEAATDTRLAASLIPVTLTCVAATKTAKMGTQEKKLPRSTQLSAVQLLCEKLFKVKVSDQKLFLKTKGDPVPQPLEQETVGGLTLDELGFQDGCELLVDQTEEQ